MTTKPRPPAGLSKRAGAFWRTILRDYELTSGELELLTEACRLLTELARLETAIDRDGVTVPGSLGQIRVHPAIGEARQHRLALARILKQLELPDLEEPAPADRDRSRRAREAANARWDLERAGKARRGTGA